ncbi:MAG TPA: hypothetical protein VJN96_18750 [Vicinamibacterales bacterium]|nr:hypothetical protein [Vicinamibacterales bacterium]
MVRVLALLLIAEGVWTVVWFTQLLSSLSWRDRSSVVVILTRALVGAAQLTTGWGLASRRPSSAALARWVLLVSAVLLTIEISWQLTPMDLDPTWRWPLVLAYWVYALVAAYVLSRATGP